MSFYYPDGEGGKKLIVTESTYSLPTASKTTKGGAKIGTGASMSGDTLNVVTMKGASSTAAGASGLVPAPAKGKQTSFLRGDGVWTVPPDNNTTYSVATTTANGLMSATDKVKLNGLQNATVMTGATSSAAGKSGLVPAPTKGKQTSFLRGDGVWTVPPDNNTTYPVATTTANGLMSATDKVKLNGLQNATVMTGATSTAAGKSGLAPAPAKGQQNTFLRGDGTWASPANTTYSTMKGASSTAAGASGLVPAPAKGKQTSFLRGDGVWTVPPDNNTTYSVATTTANGLMSATDKVKLNGLQNATVMTGATSTAAGKSGLAPAPAKGQQNTFLCGNGKWSVPPYMPISGGTFTGDIAIGTTSAPKNIVLPTIGSGIGNVHNGRSFSGMRLVGQAVQDSMSYGCDVLVQGGNKLILSAGEAGIDLYHNTVAGANSIPVDTKENIYLLADSNVVVKTNCANSDTNNGSSSKTFTFDTAGNLTATKFTGDLVGNATSATKDGSNNVIASTYVKNITSSNGALTLTKGDNSTVKVSLPATGTTFKPGNGLSMSGDTLNRDSTFTDRVTLKAGFVVPASVSSNFSSNGTVSAERTKVDFSYATLEADRSKTDFNHSDINLNFATLNASSAKVTGNFTVQDKVTLKSGFSTPVSVSSLFQSYNTIHAGLCTFKISSSTVDANGIQITADAGKYKGTLDLTGKVTVNGSLHLASNSSITGSPTFKGNPTLTGSPVFTGTAKMSTISGTPYFSQGLRISTVESSQEGAIWYVP